MVIQVVSTYCSSVEGSSLLYGYIIGVENPAHEGRAAESSVMKKNYVCCFRSSDFSKVINSGIFEDKAAFPNYYNVNSRRNGVLYSFLEKNPIASRLDDLKVDHRVLVASRSEDKVQLFYVDTDFTSKGRRASSRVLHSVPTPEDYIVKKFRNKLWVSGDGILSRDKIQGHMSASEISFTHAVEIVSDFMTQPSLVKLLSGRKSYDPISYSIYAVGNTLCEKLV